MTDYQGKQQQASFEKDMDKYFEELSKNDDHDHSTKTKQCEDNGHKWAISGIWKHNPHLWCFRCGWYLEQNEIKKKGLTEVFLKTFVMNNPEGYYLDEMDHLE